jgi:hypothetical protein
MKREHNIERVAEPTLWCKFDGNTDDDSPNHYTPYLLYNRQPSYYNNQAIVGGANRCAGYTLDKFSAGDFTFYAKVYRTGNASVAFLFTAEGQMANGDYPTVNCYFDNSGSLTLMTRLASGGTNHFTQGLNMTVPLNGWHEILLVRENGELRAYLDSELKSRQSFAYDMFTANQMWLNIGNSRSYQYGSRYFRGYIDEVKYWHNTAII